MRRWALALLLMAAACRREPVPPPARPADCNAAISVDVLHHSVELTLEPESGSLRGTGALKVRVPAAARDLALDAHSLRVTHAATGAQPLSLQQADGRVCLALPQPVAAGATLELQLAWQSLGQAKALHFAPDQIWAGYDAAAWMPTHMHSAQRATLELRLRTPRSWKAIGPGRAQPSMARAAGEHAFILDRPAPPFLFAFAAGNFAEAELAVAGKTLRALGPAGADLASVLMLTRPMLEFLERRTGHPLPAPVYTQVFVAGDAAQEAAGFALIGAAELENVRKTPEEDWVFSHELAHQWFGWLVPCTDFNDFWLNEGFATFITGVYKEQRWVPAAHAGELQRWRERSSKVHDTGRDTPIARPQPAPRVDEANLPPRGVTYARGALALHRLRSELGEATFWLGIQRYVQDRAGKGARSDDLRRALEAASGKDLRPWFERFVYSSATDL
ncbi:MAG TPA: M1 family aminopeptidase [Polyangiales bacterium]|nr:M1 family aminopeptidase [Polyangiales bacterium]